MSETGLMPPEIRRFFFLYEHDIMEVMNCCKYDMINRECGEK